MSKPIDQKSLAFVKERAGGRCEARLLMCWGADQQTHHIKSRGRGGSDDPINLLRVCVPCHHAITTHAPGTDRFRTWSWQKEGERESDEGRH